MCEPIQFEGVIEAGRGGGACISVPFDPKEIFGASGSVRVLVTYDGFEASSNVTTMGGRAVLGIHKATREAIGKAVGDPVQISLLPDTTPRTVAIPPELAEQLARHPDVSDQFDGLAFTYRKEFARWVADAKRQETKDRRAAGVIAKVRAGETL